MAHSHCHRTVVLMLFRRRAFSMHGRDFVTLPVIMAAKSLKNKKASGHDGLLAEFWKAICREDTPTCTWAVLLCNRVWQHVDVPEAWHNGLVTAIFKKGDEGSCENYRLQVVCLHSLTQVARSRCGRSHLDDSDGIPQQPGYWGCNFCCMMLD